MKVRISLCTKGKTHEYYANDVQGNMLFKNVGEGVFIYKHDLIKTNTWSMPPVKRLKKVPWQEPSGYIQGGHLMRRNRKPLNP